MVFALVPMGVIGAEVEGTDYSYAVGYVAEEDAAYGYEGITPASFTDATFRAAMEAGGFVVLSNDFIPLTGGVITISNPVTLTGVGTVVVSTNHRHFNIVEGGHLTLAGDVTLSRVAGYNEVGGGVDVRDTGVFTMNGGIISNNMGAGGGVDVRGESTFTMLGGTISNNRSLGVGGGIAIREESTFIMSGGSIMNNHGVASGGGISISGGSTATITGAEIVGNTTYHGGGGIHAVGLIAREVYTVVTISNSYFRDNTAIRVGNEISIDIWSDVTLVNNSIHDTVIRRIGTTVYDTVIYTYFPNGNVVITPAGTVFTPPVMDENGRITVYYQIAGYWNPSLFLDHDAITLPKGEVVIVPINSVITWDPNGTIIVTISEYPEEGNRVTLPCDTEVDVPAGGSVEWTPPGNYIIRDRDGNIVSGGILWGDVDGNGTVNLTDVVVLAAFVNSGHTTVMANPAAANWHGLGYRNSTLTHVIQLASYVNFRTPLPRP